jgi:transcriptional regulator with XRE-family HTH domain
LPKIEPVYQIRVVEEDLLKNNLERIGTKLTYLRKQKGYTSHEDFAYDYDIPRFQYWRIEKGKANLTIKSLCRLTKIHNLTLEEFFCILYKENKK